MASPTIDTAMLANVQFLDKANLACVSSLFQQQNLVLRWNVKWLKTPRRRREGWARMSRKHFLYLQTENRERSRPGRNRVGIERAVALLAVRGWSKWTGRYVKHLSYNRLRIFIARCCR